MVRVSSSSSASMSTSISEPAVEEVSSSSSGSFFVLGWWCDGAETDVRAGRERDWNRCLLAVMDELLMAWGGVRFRRNAGIPLGPVGRIFGEEILC